MCCHCLCSESSLDTEGAEKPVWKADICPGCSPLVFVEEASVPQHEDSEVHSPAGVRGLEGINEGGVFNPFSEETQCEAVQPEI